MAWPPVSEKRGTGRRKESGEVERRQERKGVKRRSSAVVFVSLVSVDATMSGKLVPTIWWSSLWYVVVKEVSFVKYCLSKASKEKFRGEIRLENSKSDFPCVEEKSSYGLL